MFLIFNENDFNLPNKLTMTTRAGGVWRCSFILCSLWTGSTVNFTFYKRSEHERKLTQLTFRNEIDREREREREIAEMRGMTGELVLD